MRKTFNTIARKFNRLSYYFGAVLHMKEIIQDRDATIVYYEWRVDDLLEQLADKDDKLRVEKIIYHASLVDAVSVSIAIGFILGVLFTVLLPFVPH